MRFGAPAYLPLLVAPCVFALLWGWQARRRLRDRRRYIGGRLVPVRERVPFIGDLLYWLCLLGALSSVIVALARPQAVVSSVRTAGVDLVILQDGSASMRVADLPQVALAPGLPPLDRWQRSVAFLRTLAESLRWENDRVALALFAHIAAPQIRLTRDPNTFFFFLDHLGDAPPFRLEDDGTWDTNIEQGIYWGLRLMEKDRDISGASPNGQALVLLSDGQAWSGDVETAIARARMQGLLVFVVGVGTLAGGTIPEPDVPAGDGLGIRSSLDRGSLTAIARAGGGRYVEIGRETDAAIANGIIAETRRRAPTTRVEETTAELYWGFLMAALGLIALGSVFLRDRTALVLHLTAASGVMALVAWLA